VCLGQSVSGCSMQVCECVSVCECAEIIFVSITVSLCLRFCYVSVFRCVWYACVDVHVCVCEGESVSVFLCV
jgi:hypothetical protein